MPAFSTSDGLRLHYEDAGEGLPLLCLAGLTRNARDFDPLRDRLAEARPRQRLLALDARGRGQSQHDPDFRNYNVLVEARDAAELLDHLRLERAVVLGTSRGGLVAMALAATRPARLAGVILNDVGPEVGAGGIARIRGYLGVPPAARDLDAAARHLAEDAAENFPGVPLAVWRRQAAALYAETGDGLGLRYDPRLREAVFGQDDGAGAPDLWPLFEALRPVPTVLVHGANSDILLPATVAEMRRRHPGLRLAEVPDRGHVPFLDEAESLDAILTILEDAR